MKKLFGVNPFVAALVYAVVLSLLNMIANLIRKDEPRLFKSIIAGVVAGIAITAVQYWMMVKKAKSDIVE